MDKMMELMMEREGKEFNKLYYKQKEFLKFGREVLSFSSEFYYGNLEVIVEETEEDLEELEEIEELEKEMEMIEKENERVISELKKKEMEDRELIKKLEKECYDYELEIKENEEMNEFLRLEKECCECEKKESKSILKLYLSTVGGLIWKEMFGLGCRYK